MRVSIRSYKKSNFVENQTELSYADCWTSAKTSLTLSEFSKYPYSELKSTYNMIPEDPESHPQGTLKVTTGYSQCYPQSTPKVTQEYP